MLRKILIGLGVIVVLLLGAAAFVYFKYLKPAELPVSAETRARLHLMPLPAAVKWSDARFEIRPTFSVRVINSPPDQMVVEGIGRFLEQLGRQTNTTFEPAGEGRLTVQYDSTAHPVQQPVEDESYTIEVTDEGIALHATTPFGILHGFETLLQLVSEDEGKFFFPAVRIQDAPRYPWRGLMIDAGRHWISKKSILRNLDAMAAVKLNVLHWHLSEYQGFRVESKVFPKLQQLGSGGNYYSQDDIREVISFARARGIRVIPEFDMPGHSTSWFVGYPQLAVSPGPYQTDKKFGLLTPVMDPTREDVYDFLDRFFAEMATLFPDPYFHIGGDEVVPKEWNESPAIQKFMKEKGMKDHHDLQNYFNKRVQQILARHNKKVVGWDEILHPDLAPGIVVQAWRGQKPLFEALHANRTAILSAGWYLDHKLPSSKHYQVEPEVLPGGVTIQPDTTLWQQYDVAIQVSGNTMNGSLVLYGPDDQLRGLFSFVDNNTAFENAKRKGDQLNFKFASDYGEIAVESTIVKDTLRGRMSLGFLSFPIFGTRKGGSDIPGTKPPRVEQIKPLTQEEKNLILGGEAAMWTELVTEQNIDTRIWPRMASIAEKLWTPAVLTKDIDDMYRRLEWTSDYLAKTRGTMHEKQYQAMVAGLADGHPSASLKLLMDALEEVKYYDRMTLYKDLSVETPLNEVADAALPESLEARKFVKAVERFVADSTHNTDSDFIRQRLTLWQDQLGDISTEARGNPRLEKLVGLANNLQISAKLGLSALDAIEQHRSISTEEQNDWLARLDEATRPTEGVLIATAPGIRLLVQAAPTK